MPLNTIAIIPARGGSKGIPRKNVKLLAGQPMINYILKTVQAVPGINRIIVSTDDAEISGVAKNIGAEVVMRPSELAEDTVPTLPVLQHVLSELERVEKYIPDYVLLVYPTSPLLSSERIQEALDLAESTQADSIVSGTLDTGHYWLEDSESWQRLYPLNVPNRQGTKPLFKENGAIYLSKTSVLRSNIVAETIVPLIMSSNENIDIDELADFTRVEEILNSHSV